MKRGLIIVINLLLILMISSCALQAKRPLYALEFEDSWTLLSDDLSIKIDVCDLKIDVSLHDASTVHMLLYHHLEEDLMKIDFQYVDDVLRIEQPYQQRCKSKMQENSYMILKIPQTLANVNIDLSTFLSKSVIKGASYQILNFISLNGELTMTNSTVQSVHASIIKVM